MKPLRRVWRVEHPVTRGGPWQGNPSTERYDNIWDARGVPLANCDHPSRMPTINSDRLRRSCCVPLSYMLDPVFAFPDVKTLLKWMTMPARRPAHEAGFMVRVYAADWDWHELYAEQVVFDRSKAVKLRDLSLLELDNARVHVRAA